MSFLKGGGLEAEPDRLLAYPFDAVAIHRHRRELRRRLAQREDLVDVRIAILAGSTVTEIKHVLELFLLQAGMRPVFFESGYDRVFEDGLFENRELAEFTPEIIYIHTGFRNLKEFPAPAAPENDVRTLLDATLQPYAALWKHLTDVYGCTIIQNNFAHPPARLLGNLDGLDSSGRTRFVRELNRLFCDAASEIPGLHIHDVNYLSATVGLDTWFDESVWCLAKYGMSYAAMPALAHSLAALLRATRGGAAKCLVLDLDNTLWGGVIGDDGPEGIRLGRDTPEGEAYTRFQEYVRGLKDRGVLLAVCSKNDEATALEGLAHPDSCLSRDDFAAFLANWQPKSESLRELAEILNLGLDSFVFVDDNPAERELIRSQLPEVAVPEIGSDPTAYTRILDRSRYFDSVSVSADDLARSSYYTKDAQRRSEASRFTDYSEFLESLDMEAVFYPIEPVYLDRATQLINKTNQFNLTTRRLDSSEVREMADAPDHITLCARLRDTFGDNGLISVLIGRLDDMTVEIDNWVMSCRVFKRRMEHAMMDEFVRLAREKGVRSVRGRFVPTKRNGVIRDLLPSLGFARETAEEDGASTWILELSDYANQNTLIKVIRE